MIFVTERASCWPKWQLAVARAAEIATVAVLSLTLQGCFQDTCMGISEFPALSSCSGNQFCSNQDSAKTIEFATMDECLAECAYQNCTAIQYDCGTRCMILESCGPLAQSTCGSSVYFVNKLLLTTTTTSTTLLGSCFFDSEPNDKFACTPASFCRNEVSGINLGEMSLSDCLAECDIRWNCLSAVYSCGRQCWIFGSGCGGEVTSACGSSVYHKAAWTTTTPGTAVTTTSSQDLSSLCFQGVVNTGAYSCSPMSQCRNQAFAASQGRMTLADCMALCDDRADCTTLLHECTGQCSLMLGLNCEGDLPMNFDTYRGACGSLYRKVATTTTTVPSSCLVGGALPLPEYRCEPSRSCTDHGLNLGNMSLEACMAQCELYDCGAIQYECGSQCILLETCSDPTDSSCGSVVYFRDRAWPFWAETTTTTTVPGRCRPDTTGPLLDFACQPGLRCQEQAVANKLGPMSLDRCAEFCRARSYECQFIQYECNSECWLMNSCTTTVSDCGGSVYGRLTFAEPARQHFSFDRMEAVAYSLSCFGEGCEVTAYCPYLFWPTHCELITSQGGSGIRMRVGLTSGYCTAIGRGPVITVEARCTKRLRTMMYTPESPTTSVGCPAGSTLMSCNCWSEGSHTACSQVSFPVSDLAPRCEVGDAGGGARIGAICATGEATVRVQNAGPEQKQVSETEVQYCGWADVSDFQDEADCRGWMQDPSNVHVGGCKTSECTEFADCVHRCNACSACVGVRHMADGSPLYEDEGIQCTMQRKEDVSGITPVLAPRSGPVVYVNTRGAECFSEHSIRRISLFEDADCTRTVYPESAEADGRVVQSNWSVPEESYVPDCSPRCSFGQIVIRASFSTPTPVLCAVLHSSWGFSQGWQLYTGSREIATSAGARVSYGRTPNDPESFQKGATVTFEGPLVIWCFTDLASCINPMPWAPTLALQFSRMLQIPVHAIHMRSGNPRSQWADLFRRLSPWTERALQSGLSTALRISFKFVINSPQDAVLVHAVAADLEDMIR